MNLYLNYGKYTIRSRSPNRPPVGESGQDRLGDRSMMEKDCDLNQKIKFVVSGSTSLLLINSAKKSLTGRIFQKSLGPLSFSEYQLLSGRKDWDEFLYFGQFPELLEFSSLEKKREYLKESVIGKVLEIDIPKIYKLRKIFDFERIFWSLISNSGQIISSSQLMSDLGLKKATLFKYLTVLEQSLLINKVLNLNGSFRSEKRLLRKLYPASSNFLTLSPQFLPIGFAAETYVASLLNTSGINFYLYRQRDKEIDFLLPDQKLAIEIKFQNQTFFRDYKTLSRYIREKNYRGIIVTKNQEKILDKEKIRLITLENFEQFLSNPDPF